MMNISWQDIFYVVATLTMVVVIVVFIWIIRILFILSKLISNLVQATQRLGNGIDDIKDLSKNITVGILRKIRNILDKGGEYEQ